MEGQSRYCPHLGLKHTRSIRFSSPTPEHRCYIFGEPVPIGVDQRTYCLGQGYTECPRFSGREGPPTAEIARVARAPRAAPLSGVGAFWGRLSTRDRVLYLSLAFLLVAILATYGIIVGIVLPRGRGGAAGTPVAGMVATTAVPASAAKATSTVSAVVDTAVATTVVPVPTVTVRPTATSGPPTSTPRPTTVAPTSVPTETPRPATATPRPPTATSVVVAPTVTPAPEYLWSTLYFLGENKAYYVPVSRQGPFTLGVARRAIESMIDGPRAGSNLLRSMPAGMGLVDIYVQGGTCYVNLDHRFEDLGAGWQEAMAVVLALTEFSTVERVQFLVNGVAVGFPGSSDTGPVARPSYVNFDDPYGLSPADSVHLTLYLATPGGQYLFPVVRRVPFTTGVARAAIEEMVKGPSAAYQGVAASPFPAATQIVNIYRENSTIVVDFNSAFLNSTNPDLAVKALILAMTSLTADSPAGVDSVRIYVEGKDLGTYWGATYSGNLYRPLLNPEY